MHRAHTAPLAHSDTSTLQEASDSAVSPASWISAVCCLHQQVPRDRIHSGPSVRPGPTAHPGHPHSHSSPEKPRPYAINLSCCVLLLPHESVCACVRACVRVGVGTRVEGRTRRGTWLCTHVHIHSHLALSAACEHWKGLTRGLAFRPTKCDGGRRRVVFRPESAPARAEPRARPLAPRGKQPACPAVAT